MIQPQSRKPYPFFASVEFLTVLVKVGTVSSPFLIAIATSGFTLPNVSALLFSGVITGCLMAAKELEIHQNLYTPDGISGRDKSDAIANIQVQAATAIASKSQSTVQEVLNTVPIKDLVDFAVKPSLSGSGAKLFGKLLEKMF